MEFELFSKISQIEIIAVATGIRDIKRLRRAYGAALWRNLKGIAQVRLPDGVVCQAELHWYEAHGIGKREMKIKRLLED